MTARDSWTNRKVQRPSGPKPTAGYLRRAGALVRLQAVGLGDSDFVLQPYSTCSFRSSVTPTLATFSPKFSPILIASPWQ